MSDQILRVRNGIENAASRVLAKLRAERFVDPEYPSRPLELYRTCMMKTAVKAKKYHWVHTETGAAGNPSRGITAGGGGGAVVFGAGEGMAAAPPPLEAVKYVL